MTLRIVLRHPNGDKQCQQLVVLVECVRHNSWWVVEKQ